MERSATRSCPRSTARSSGRSKNVVEAVLPHRGRVDERALASLERFRDGADELEERRGIRPRCRASSTSTRAPAGTDAAAACCSPAYCTPILDGRTGAATRRTVSALRAAARPGEGAGRRDPRPQHAERSDRALPDAARDRGRRHVGGQEARAGVAARIRSTPTSRTSTARRSSACRTATLRLGYAGKNGQRVHVARQRAVRDKQLEQGRGQPARDPRVGARASRTRSRSTSTRNDRYVFFTPIDGNPRGSLNVEVTAERSLATDKTLVPARRDGLRRHASCAGIARGRARSTSSCSTRTPAARSAPRAAPTSTWASAPKPRRSRARRRAEGQLYYLFVRDDPSRAVSCAARRRRVHRTAAASPSAPSIRSACRSARTRRRRSSLRSSHGGAHRAVCLFSIEDYALVAARSRRLRRAGHVRRERAHGRPRLHAVARGRRARDRRRGDARHVRIAIHDVREPCGTLKTRRQALPRPDARPQRLRVPRGDARHPASRHDDRARRMIRSAIFYLSRRSATAIPEPPIDGSRDEKWRHRCPTDPAGDGPLYHEAQDRMALLPNYYAWIARHFIDHVSGTVLELGSGAGHVMRTTSIA